jgi:acyl carrier protein
MQSYQRIVGTINEILTERGERVPALGPETTIRETGLDSLDVAALVVRLESALGIDPFADPTLTQYPQTVGELAALYDTALR